MDKANTGNMNNSDTENWVMVNSCDVAEEAITLNKITDSDHESESSISIISGVPTPNECSEDEVLPNKELPEEIESLSTSTRSSVEKIEISDEESLSSLSPMIKVAEDLESTLIGEILTENVQGHFDKDDNVTQDENFEENEDNVHEEKISHLLISCPKVVIQTEEITNDQEYHDGHNGKENIDDKTEPLMEIKDFEREYQTMQYDLPPIIEDSDSWTDNDSTSDYISQDTQLVTASPTLNNRQEGIAAVLSQNGLFIGAVFFFATALLKLYLLKDNTDMLNDTFSYELNKLKKQYQSVDVNGNGQVDNTNDGNYETIVQFCTAKHGSKQDPFHRNNHKVEKCINRRIRKLYNREETKRKKISLDIREKLLEIREKELQKREEELIARFKKIYKQDSDENSNEDISLSNLKKQYYKKNKDEFNEKHKRMHEDVKNRIKLFKNKQKTQIEKLGSQEKSDRTKIKYTDTDYDYISITTENDPINELREKISNTETSEINNKNLVTFKEIALAFREKELVRKLQDYNNNLANRINDIFIPNHSKQHNSTEKRHNKNLKKSRYLSEKNVKTSNKNQFKKENDRPKNVKSYTSEEKLYSSEEIAKHHKYENDIKQKSETKREYKKTKYYKSGEKENKNGEKIKNDMYTETKYFKRFNKGPGDDEKKVYQFKQEESIIFKPSGTYMNKKQKPMKKMWKNVNYKEHDPRDELYIKYNPVTNIIDIVNISQSEDRNFILLENGNKTVNGQWYINLHHARSMLRTKEKAADWYFDRVLYRELKRNKAKWYFHYMSGRENSRECFI